MALDVKTVNIGGTDYKVSQLCWEQLQEVMPRAQTLEPYVRESLNEGVLNMPSEAYGLMIEAIYHGLRLDNDVTLEQLKRIKSSPQNMFAAYLIVRFQTGAWVKVEDGQSTEGEAPGR